MTFALAMAIFMSPAGENDVPPPKSDWPQICSVLRDTAIKMELLDRSERYIISDLKDYQLDINIIRDRYQKYKNYPTWGWLASKAQGRHSWGKSI